MAKKNGKPILFVGSLGLIVHFPDWVERPLGDLIRANYYLEEDWRACFQEGDCESDLLDLFLHCEEQRSRFKQFVMYILPQAERAGRVRYFQRGSPRSWTPGLNRFLQEIGLTPIPPDKFRIEGPIEELRKLNPNLDVYS